MVWRCAAMAASNSLRNSACSLTRMLLIFGPSGSTPKARSMRRVARLQKYFVSIPRAKPQSSSIPRISPRKPSPSTPKGFSTWVLLLTARFTKSRLPAKSPFSSIRKQNTSGTSLSLPTGLSTSPPGIRVRSSPLPLTAKANSSTPATRHTFAFWRSIQTETWSSVLNRAAASCASPGVPQDLPPKIPPRRKPRALFSTKPPSEKSLPWLSPLMAPLTFRRLAKSSAPGRLPPRLSRHRKARLPSLAPS